MKKSVVLVGLMGAGKTRTGPLLADLLGLSFVDSDREIERISGISVAEMFEKYGEAAFRAEEKRVFEALLLSGAPKVIAAGGGAFVQKGTKEIIKNHALSVWLKANLQVLVKRIGKGEGRPLLQGGNVEEKLRSLMEAREPVYAEADITVVTDTQTPQNIALSIKSALDRLCA